MSYTRRMLAVAALRQHVTMERTERMMPFRRVLRRNTPRNPAGHVPRLIRLITTPQQQKRI